MKSDNLVAAAALVLLCTLALAPQALAAGADDGADGPPIATTTESPAGGDDSPDGGTELGPAADPDGLIAASPVDGQGTISVLSWLESAFGVFLRSLF